MAFSPTQLLHPFFLTRHQPTLYLDPTDFLSPPTSRHSILYNMYLRYIPYTHHPPTHFPLHTTSPTPCPYTHTFPFITLLKLSLPPPLYITTTHTSTPFLPPLIPAPFHYSTFLHYIFSPFIIFTTYTIPQNIFPSPYHPHFSYLSSPTCHFPYPHEVLSLPTK